MDSRYDVIILGAGPAGLTAGIYLARSKVKTLIIDEGTPGGQVIMSHMIANYPGVEETSGHALSRTMLKQAKSFGCDVITQSKILHMDLESSPKRFNVDFEGEFLADAVILATGGVPRTLGIESEEKFKGHGISYCATCDGEFFTDKEIVAVGGGNSALEESLSLSKYASKVTIIHEFNEFQAHPFVVDEVKKNPKIELLLNQKITNFEGTDVEGDNKFEAVISTDKESGKENRTKAAGCFIFIGYVPNTGTFKDSIKLNSRGEILTDEDLKTNVEGVFAAGDSRQKKYRQITTAVADGTVSALSAIEYLSSIKK
ncbi:MAG: FAD-dependent oxidoreductase [Deltaproteobacteria bacterium]|nr:FAD-dependent oxidoreductase [Deltaproteobacteria bacterium]